MMRRLLKLAAGILTAAGVLRSLRGSSTDAPDTEKHRTKPTMKQRLFTAGAVLALFAVGGFLVAVSGIVPIKASSGHWGITAWFLNFSMHRSVATHTIGMEAPPLDDPALVLRGAGHYDSGCRPCHGSPALHQPRIAREMTPHPPYLPPVLASWKPEELFYIVKHGVKLTGMPAWPARQRDDEVWAMVAFLRTLPELDVQEYRQLTQGAAPEAGSTPPVGALSSPRDVPPAVRQSCARCHGTDGQGRGRGAFPRLAGQHPAYLYNALEAFAQGERHSGIMEPVAAGLNPEEMQELARYYAGLSEPPPPAAPVDVSEAIERGETIATEGIPRQGVPSCTDCHGPSTARRNPAYPVLAGQYADYLVLQLELFKKEHRGGSPYAHLMRPVAERLTPEQMRDVALYYESLRSGLNGPSR